jgi:hypothetical protein
MHPLILAAVQHPAYLTTGPQHSALAKQIHFYFTPKEVLWLILGIAAFVVAGWLGLRRSSN